MITKPVNLCLSSEWIKYIRKLEIYRVSGRLPVGISTENNIGLYDQLLQKHTQGIYAKRPNPIGDKLIKGEKEFRKKTTEDQCFLSHQILRISSIGADSQADLRRIGGSEHTGVMNAGKNITNCSECLLINRTALGITEQVIDLRTI